ncbi:alpha/beta hydrolase [Roseivivax sp. GX 12232]|uniref:alpha/beta fold hydrolase n=1 Tax=Roseivivax sp. GX 12232 TaxID=2900547 RepID=UPI001E3CC00A|nr:alpha/beta hydrolase [Roseivivax sp. GX 12232]MCE0503768.1 alpha/beta hydrolase [Roseivivax sp. GX 12232]
MAETAPFLAQEAEGPEGARALWVAAVDGTRLRIGHYPGGAAGTVLLLPGRTEYIEKYGRTAADFARAGYHTLTIDWRGQGLSDRLLTDVRTGHVHVFDDYQRDLDAALSWAEAEGLPKPWHLLAHSMGGCIGLRALMNGLPVAGAGFTGPMWGIRISPFMRPAAWALSWSSSRVGLGHTIAPGTSPDSYVVAETFDDNLLTRDREMYDYMRAQVIAEPGLQLGGPSLRWLNEALVECRTLARMPAPDYPCLTFVGSNERIVDVPRIAQRMAGWPGGRLVTVPGGEHEVLMEGPEVRGEITEALIAHYDAAGASTREEENGGPQSARA